MPEVFQGVPCLTAGRVFRGSATYALHSSAHFIRSGTAPPWGAATTAPNAGIYAKVFKKYSEKTFPIDNAGFKAHINTLISNAQNNMLLQANVLYYLQSPVCSIIVL